MFIVSEETHLKLVQGEKSGGMARSRVFQSPASFSPCLGCFLLRRHNSQAASTWWKGAPSPCAWWPHTWKCRMVLTMSWEGFPPGWPGACARSGEGGTSLHESYRMRRILREWGCNGVFKKMGCRADENYVCYSIAIQVWSTGRRYHRPGSC